MSVIIKQIPPEPGTELMGLEALGLSVFPGVKSSFEIPIINGRYNIGQNDPKYKDRIKEFEDYLRFSFDSEEGYKWLEEHLTDLSHDTQALDPTSKFEDRFILHVLEVNGGFGIVALNANHIEEYPINNFKFSLTNEDYEVEKRISKKENKLRATATISKLYESKTNRLILLAKYLLSISSGIGTSKQTALDKLTDFIDQSSDNVEKFNNAAVLDPEYIDSVVKVKEAIFTGIIVLGQDGQFTLKASGDKLGKTESEVIQFLLLPKNKHLLGEGTKDDLPYSISAQLKDTSY